ncbi:hypothetical protein [Peribacillus asahii]|uniref:hypothetical protein n=1 Tax=Peribacillus asahii TaxID=228899 RepID=UPI002079BF9C|nr:hypothetical protein [Peribacillus asahii]USK58120.1 hypothetical protein LIT37_12615 [Peribacillus asahii]
MSTIQFARNNISLGLQPSQMSIEEFYEDPHEGVEYTIDENGEVNVPPGQLDMEDAAVKH